MDEGEERGTIKHEGRPLRWDDGRPLALGRGTKKNEGRGTTALLGRGTVKNEGSGMTAPLGRGTIKIFLFFSSERSGRPSEADVQAQRPAPP
ncbi:MAG: hypothetical protein C4576_34265 [Desulfobacteraceae bacterium]|nr:MAG: hypothetical protein C4576_34265 [Desulfobacteraceae bacterium]